MNRPAEPSETVERPMLVCLDLQRAPEGEPRSWAVPDLAAAGARLLDHARRNGWSVVHVYRTGPFPRRLGRPAATPIPGFEPRPNEPVYVRRGMSAFSSARFAEAVGSSGEGEILLAGADLGASGLATAFDAHERGVSITLVEDVFGAAPLRGVEASVVEEVLRKLVAPFARFSCVDAVLSRAWGAGCAAFANDD
jgi:nicotinamidase-related amidase